MFLQLSWSSEGQIEGLPYLSTSLTYPCFKYLTLRMSRWFPLIHLWRVEIISIFIITLNTTLQLSCPSSDVEHLSVPISLWKEHECKSIAETQYLFYVLACSLPRGVWNQWGEMELSAFSLCWTQWALTDLKINEGSFCWTSKSALKTHVAMFTVALIAGHSAVS